MKYIDAFVDIPFLLNICQGRPVVVWGTNAFGTNVAHTLEANGITVSCFGDNAAEKAGTLQCGKSVLGPKEVSQYHNPVVVIGCYWYRSIIKQMRQLGIEDVYFLYECYSYPYEEMLADQRFLASLPKREHAPKSVLVELYGNLGDTILAAGLVRELFCRFGRDNVYILVEKLPGDINAQFFQLMTSNVISLDCTRMDSDRDYRRAMIQQIDELCVSLTICPCRPLSNARRRRLSHFTLRTNNVYMSRTEGIYALDSYRESVNPVLGTDANISPVCVIQPAMLSAAKMPLPRKPYVALHLGASDPLRRYPVEDFLPVLQYLLKSGIHVALLGWGEVDNDIAQKILESDLPSGFHNFTSQLPIAQSLFVISKARFFIGTDSAMHHAAYILKKPSLILYGQGEYGCFRHPEPWMHYVESSALHCKGCGWDCETRNARNLPRCIGEITSAQIIAQIKQLLEDEGLL